MTLAQRLRAYRLARGYTQAALSERAGVNENTYQRIERGKQPGCNLDTLLRIAAAYGVSLSELLKDVS